MRKPHCHVNRGGAKHMKNVAALLYVLILDAGVISTARDIILDFLRGTCSKREFRKLMEKQSFTHKLSLRFIREYIKIPEYKKPYSFYLYSYYIFICVSIVKNIALLFREQLTIDPQIVIFINISLSILFYVVFSIEAPGKRHSRYAGKQYSKIS